MKVGEVRSKTLLTRSRIPGAEYCINPYVGCAHACRYCYARFMRTYSGHSEPWGRFVDAKVNAPEVLRRQLARGAFRGRVLVGTVTDGYQPAEREYRLLPELLEILARFHVPVSILTKSDLVVRDMDLLLSSGAEVGFSVASDREAFRAALEPGAPSIERRLAALETLHRAGIPTYVFVSPIFPRMTDLRSLVERVAGKTHRLMAEALNPRFGNWPEVASVLRRRMPGALTAVRGEVGSGAYWDEVEEALEDRCRAAGLTFGGLFRHTRGRTHGSSQS